MLTIATLDFLGILIYCKTTPVLFLKRISKNFTPLNQKPFDNVKITIPAAIKNHELKEDPHNTMSNRDADTITHPAAYNLG